ncbi:hypothetical protein BKA66DRAFT_575549 [Pyrenochaeta sp. MPI-SDFR-AT-0127]|nr:hypothetical protein BKA66DRAFT_575549 [Pyrenochaeta sp. MPI-SDFR-AT-0127]
MNARTENISERENMTIVEEKRTHDCTSDRATEDSPLLPSVSTAVVTESHDTQPTEEVHRQVLLHSLSDSDNQNCTGVFTPSSPLPDRKDPNTEMSTPALAVALLDHAPALYTPSNTAPSPDRALSRLISQSFPGQNKDAKHTHYKRGRIFVKTQQRMQMKTKKMSVIASRGHGRANYVPSRRTRPPLLKRRYSIEVITKNWENWKKPGWEQGDSAEVCIQVGLNLTEHSRAQQKRDPDELSQIKYTVPQYHENEPLVQPNPPETLPDPRRYITFSFHHALRPPCNDEIYLELGDATIRNDAFLYIGVTDWTCGLEAWMRGESIDMALEVLRRDQDCDDYSIDIANSNSAQVFYLAAMCNDGSSREYDEYRIRFHNKRWIFVVINDAFGGVENNGTKGSHWSLVALDRIHKTVHYYDSLYINWEANRAIGHDVGKGLLLILDEDMSRWAFRPEWNSPSQVHDNLAVGDIGPCGPFVYRMTEMLIEHIKYHYDNGSVFKCSLGLPEDFNAQFGQLFHSKLVRQAIQHSIAQWKCRIDTSHFMHEHDRIAVRDESVILSAEPPPTLNISHQSIFPVHQQQDQARIYYHHDPTPSPDLVDTDQKVATELDVDFLYLGAEVGRCEDLSSSRTESIRLGSPQHPAIIDVRSEANISQEREIRLQIEDPGDFSKLLPTNVEGTSITDTPHIPVQLDDEEELLAGTKLI